MQRLGDKMKEKIDWNIIEIMELQRLVDSYKSTDTEQAIHLMASSMSYLCQYVELDESEFEELQKWMYYKHRWHLNDLKEKEKEKEKEK